MHLNGQVFENICAPTGTRLWEVRIPLPGNQYVDFFRDFETESSPLILSAFVSTVERGITACLARGAEAEHQAEVLQMRPAEMYYTARAGAKSTAA